MEQKDRKPGYYWVTSWKERTIAKWNGSYWEIYTHTQNRAPEDITDINEKQIVEDESTNWEDVCKELHLALLTGDGIQRYKALNNYADMLEHKYNHEDGTE